MGELIGSSVALTNGAGVGGGTLLNAPVAGNPTKWIPIRMGFGDVLREVIN